LKSTEKDKTGRFVIHTVQLKPRLACKTLEVNRMISVTSQSETVQPFAVQVLEIYVSEIYKYVKSILDFIFDSTFQFLFFCIFIIFILLGWTYSRSGYCEILGESRRYVYRLYYRIPWHSYDKW